MITKLIIKTLFLFHFSSSPISARVASAAHVRLSRGCSISELTIDINGATNDLDTD